MHRRKTAAQNPASPYDSYYGNSSASPGYGADNEPQPPRSGPSVSSNGVKSSYSGPSLTSKKRKEKKRSDNSNCGSLMVICLSFIIVMSWIAAGLWVNSSNGVNERLTKEKHALKEEYHRDSSRKDDRLRLLQESLTREKRDNRSLQAKALEKTVVVKAQDSDNTIELALRERMETMKKKIARESRRDVIEKFGEGPYHVQMVVNSSNNIKNNIKGSFVIQMHSLDEMPHAVHLFLEQVAHGLWNGCGFVINASHLLQAGAHPSHIPIQNMDQRKLDSFKRHSLDTMAFQEYHPNCRHEKWSLGFAGRPAGPDFYINKLDNSKSHGPGGQKQHDLDEEADPSFGKVVDGFDILNQIFSSPVDGGFDLLTNVVQITEAKVIAFDNKQQNLPDRRSPPQRDPNVPQNVNQNADRRSPPQQDQNNQQNVNQQGQIS